MGRGRGSRRQPGWEWLAFGVGIAVAMWTLCTVALALAFGLSTTFGRTYGPLAKLSRDGDAAGSGEGQEPGDRSKPGWGD